MVNIQAIKGLVKQGTLPIERLCNIKNYLKTEEKFRLVQEYKKLILEHKDDYGGAIPFIGFVFFHLLVIKYYTNIQIDFDYQSFDELMESDILPLVLKYIQSDYNLLLKICDLNLEKDDVK